MDDEFMGNGAGSVAVMEGIQASITGLDALFRADAGLESDPALGASRPAGAGPDVAVVDVLGEQLDNRLERLALWARLEAQVAAGKALDVAEAVRIQAAMTPPEATGADRGFAQMSVEAEIAGVLTISSGTANNLVNQSQRICAMPPVPDALAAGAVSWRHALIMADQTEALTPDQVQALVAHFFDPDAANPARGPAPGELVPARFRHKVRTWRERTYPHTLEQRHALSLADRRMEYRPEPDGMATITLRLAGDTACAIWNKTTAIARGLQGPDEHRTLTQLRPDIAAKILLGAGPATLIDGSTGDGSNGGGSGGGPEHDMGDGVGGRGSVGGLCAVDFSKAPALRADVLVTVPVLTLLGITDEPAEVDGFGPVPASVARRLVADGATSFYRVLVDPRDGAPLEIGRTSYRLTEAMKRWIRMRDGKCTFPGCGNPTTDNENDHLTAWQHGGATGASNLTQLCPRHHRLKHHSGWEPTPATTTEPPGWTSPPGRHYNAEQHHYHPPQWPPAPPAREVEDTGAAGLAVPVDDNPDAATFDAEDFPPEILRLLKEYAELPAWHFPPDDVAPDDAAPDYEPPGEDLIDVEDIWPDDPLWESFYAKPFILPPDPLLAEWQLGLLEV